MKKISILLASNLILSITCIHQKHEVPIETEHFVHTDISSLLKIRENYSCIIEKPDKAENAIVRCFPTVEYLKHRIFPANYISCDFFPPGEVLIGIFKNPNPYAQNPYCFIWAFEPAKKHPNNTNPPKK